MKRLLFCACLLAPVVASANPFDQFKTNVQSSLIKPFALDLGGVLGSAASGPVVPLNFPGFEVGVSGGVQSHPDKDDLILRNANVKAFGVPLVQAAVAVPLIHVDVMAHGMGAYGARIFGAGLRSGWRSPLITPFIPSVGVQAYVDKLNQTYFNAWHYAADATASWGLPIVQPFIGLGVDRTKVTVGAATTPAVAGLSASATGSRVTLGAELTPLPLLRVRGAYVLSHGIPGFEAGLGVRF